MGNSHLTLGNGSHCGTFSRMKNTLHQTSYVVPAESGAPVAAIAVLRNTFEAMFPTLEVRPAPEGPACSLRYPTTTDGLTYPSVIILELSPGGGGGGSAQESALLVIFLATLHSDQPDGLVYSL